MTDLLQEFCDSRGVALRVDRAGGVIRGIKILGPHSRNGREYLPEALARAVGLYEGAKVNVNHPKGHPLAPRDYQERIGVIRNVQHRAGEGLFGDFHFNPKHKLGEQLAWDAEHAPENVGFSHNVHARTSRRGETTVIDEIVSVHSVDLVADPATTRGLFESTAGLSPSPSTAESRGEGDSKAERGMGKAADVGTADRREVPIAEQTMEIEQLRAEVDRLRAQEAIQTRRDVATALLAEYRLPRPDSTDGASKAIVSDAFVESLLAAPDEPAVRRLIEERARLVGSAVQWNERSAALRQRPLSRDQALVELASVSDGKAFARAITR